MPRRSSFNVNGLALGGSEKEQKLLNFVRRYRPTTMTVMDNFGFAQAVHEASGGHTRVFYRHYLPESEEGAYIDRQDARGYVNLLTSHGDPRIFRYAINEHYGDMQRLGAFLGNVADELVQRGYKGVVGNFSGGVYPASDIAAGKFDELLKKLSVYSKQDKVYLGAHEYSLGLLPFGIGYWALDRLYNPASVQPGEWPIPVHYNRQPNGDLPPFEYLLRHVWLNLRCTEVLKIRPPKKVLTEYGIDYMPDKAPTGVYQRLQSQYGASGYSQIRGHRTYEDAWRAYFPYWSYWRSFYEQLMWSEKIMPDDVIGWNLFTWSEAPDWGERGFRLTDSDELLDLLIHNAHKEPSPTMPEKAPKPVNAGVGIATQMMYPSVYVNIRETPNGRDIGDLSPSQPVTVYPATWTKDKVGNYYWVYVETDISAGYIADIARFVNIPVNFEYVRDAQPQPPSDLATLLTGFSPDFKTSLKQFLSRLHEKL